MIEVNTQATLLRLQKPLVNALVEIASTDYYRAIHNKIGVLHDYEQETTTLVATDRYRLLVYSLPIRLDLKMGVYSILSPEAPEDEDEDEYLFYGSTTKSWIALLFDEKVSLNTSLTEKVEGIFPNYLRALLAEPKKMGTYHGAVFAPTLRIEGILFSQCSFLPKLPYDGEIFTGDTNVGGICGPQYQLHFAPAEGETCIYAWMGVKPKPEAEEKADAAAEDPR